MGTQSTAIHKREWLLKRFKLAREAGVTLSKYNLIGEFCLTFSSTRRTALEFLTHFEGARAIKIIDDEILMSGVEYDEFYNETTKKWEKMLDNPRSPLRMA